MRGGRAPVDAERVLRAGRRFLEEEGNAILSKRDALGEPFVRLVERLLALRGKVGVSGVGKSGIIGEKIAATLSSTGTPAFFLKPVDGVHGDLGVLREEDYLIAISNSGETPEVLAVVEAARALGVEVAAMTGNLESTLAHEAQIALDIGVSNEACPLGLAPTTSTTVTLAVGDALALVLLQLRDFTAEGYARFHPGGALGQRLKYRVSDVATLGEASVPAVGPDAPLCEALREMTDKGNLGVTLVVGEADELVGIVTDGDLRRLLLRGQPQSGETGPWDTPVGEVMSKRPKVVAPDTPVSEALRILEVHGITSLPVVDARSRPVGVLHLHDILGRGKILL